MYSVEDREPKKGKGLAFKILKILPVSQGGNHLSWKAEAGGSLEHRISGPTWATQSRSHLKYKKKKKENQISTNRSSVYIQYCILFLIDIVIIHIY